jgi:WD40 repeat protein
MRDGRIHTLLTDADRLLLAYKIPIIEGALHVYHSALATMPSCLLLEEAALHDGHGIPFLITNRAPGWGVRETILEVHSENGFEFTYSPNGKLIASVSADRDEIQVWDVTTGTALNTISVPSTEKGGEFIRFSSVAFSPNSQWIVSARTDFTVRLWDVVTGSQHRVMSGHTGWVSCLAFSPDGTIIVSCSDDRTLRVWDVCTGTEQRVITGHSARVNSLAFAPNGQTIVSASSDSTLRVWDALTGTQLRVIEGDNKGFYDVAFSPDGATIASGSSDGTLQLWSATTNMQQHTLVHTVHTNCAYSLSFSPDSRSIVSCEVSSEVRIWDVTTGIEKCRLREGAMAVAYSPDGKSIAMALCKGTIRIWDTNTSVAAPPISEGHQTKISSVTFSSDGLLVASGSYDQTVRIWDAVTGTERHVMEVGSSVWSVAFSPDNRTVACGQLGGTVQLWDVPSGSKQYSMTSQHTQDVYSVAFSSDGKSLVSYSPSDGMARAWDVASGAEQHILTHPVDPVAHESGGIPLMPVAFSPDGKTITLLDGSVVIGYWDLTIGQPKYTESTSPYEQTPAVYPFHGPEQHHFGEVENRDWILHCNGQKEPKRVCWLPPERRGEFAYSGTKVCVGEQDGMIMILDFSPVDLPQ